MTCHSIEDLNILNSRAKTHYDVQPETLRIYEEKIIPYWRGRSMREKMFAQLPAEWHDAYGAGLFTEFMEQRAPGHTVLDGKIYSKGMLDFKRDIAGAIAGLDFLRDASAFDKRETLRSFDIACDAVIRLAERHAALAREMAAAETDAARRAELEKIAEVCSRVPAQAPRDFHEVLQYYNSYVQFVGLGSLTDSLSALRQFCLDSQAGGAPAARNGDGPQAGSRLPISELVAILDADFAEHELLRQRLVNRAHKYGNDDDGADDLAVAIFNTCFEELDCRPNAKGGHYRIETLPTTCHVYFGSAWPATAITFAISRPHCRKKSSPAPNTKTFKARRHWGSSGRRRPITQTRPG